MISFLNKHWKNWIYDLKPLDTRMEILDKYGIKGMSSHNIRFFINEFSRQFIDGSNGEKYVEVGTYHGCSLLSSALYNDHDCIGIDNFSQFNAQGNNEQICRSNISKLNRFLNSKVTLYDSNFELFFNNYEVDKSNIKIYFYDGAHDYESQLKGLEIVLPYLCEQCIIFVDDVNLGSVRKANDHFLAKHPKFKRVLQILTKGNCSPDWWNGWEVIARGYDFKPIAIDLKTRQVYDI